MSETIFIRAGEMQERFYEILWKAGFTREKALRCAEVFTSNSVDGVYTHGVNRFSRFIQYVQKGYVKTEAEPYLKNAFGGMEQWDGALGAGPLNALQATERAITLSRKHGIGCVALANTNHWMRGGAYGWKAAKKGFAFIGWTNTLANMPAWGAIDSKLGNNPLVLALPFKEEAIVLDMAMSQFSFGTLEQSVMQKKSLPVYGGYDNSGHLSTDPAAISQSKRPLPIGYWKGAGLSLLLDLMATLLSGGLSTFEVSDKEAEYGLSQVFIVIDLSQLKNPTLINITIKNIIDDYHNSIPEDEKIKIMYPGEGVLQRRKTNLEKGIPVLRRVWDEVLRL